LSYKDFISSLDMGSVCELGCVNHLPSSIQGDTTIVLYPTWSVSA
jgi:hypothetical protein